VTELVYVMVSNTIAFTGLRVRLPPAAPVDFMLSKRVDLSNPGLLAYIVGLALGDGNLSNPNGRATTLRISCDTKYPSLIWKIFRSIELLLPDNKVGAIKKEGNCIDIISSSNHWEKLLGWQAHLGSKFEQKVTVPDWIWKHPPYAINCLRGLIESDGSIYTDRGYTMMQFVSIIPSLAFRFNDMIHDLGFKPRIYKIERQANPYGYNQQILYHIRLSKNVSEFLDLVKPQKF
jgi:hypothetical protein